MKRYFVTGISTDVGKTFCSAVLVEALNADYWKPVQTGNTDGTDNGIIQQLISNEESVIHKEIYSYEKPASPHIAAFCEHETIDLEKIVLPKSTNKNLIIEGAGGLLVPLNEKEYIIDLVKHLDAEIILVVREYLGCINHTLLTIDYLIKNNYLLKGIVLNGNFHPLAEKSIVEYANVPVLARFQALNGISKKVVYDLAKQIDLSLF